MIIIILHLRVRRKYTQVLVKSDVTSNAMTTVQTLNDCAKNRRKNAKASKNYNSAGRHTRQRFCSPLHYTHSHQKPTHHTTYGRLTI